MIKPTHPELELGAGSLREQRRCRIVSVCGAVVVDTGSPAQQLGLCKTSGTWCQSRSRAWLTTLVLQSGSALGSSRSGSPALTGKCVERPMYIQQIPFHPQLAGTFLLLTTKNCDTNTAIVNSSRGPTPHHSLQLLPTLLAA